MTRNETIVLIIASIAVMFGIYRIYAKSDGKRGMSLPEFQKMAAFLLFYGAIIFMMFIEAFRKSEYHVFSDLWMAFAITGLFSALHMTEIIVQMTNLIDALIRLRMKTPVTKTTIEANTDVQITNETTDSKSGNA